MLNSTLKIFKLMGRNTRTGNVFEEMVLPALRMGGYEILSQVNLGERLGGGKHKADIVAEKDGMKIIVSLKWQQTSGTAEQKVPYEFMCLADAVHRNHDIQRAYIVIGGNGWTKDRFFIYNLDKWVNTKEDVQVMRSDSFIALANQGEL